MDIQINLFDYTSVKVALKHQPDVKQQLLAWYQTGKKKKEFNDDEFLFQSELADDDDNEERDTDSGETEQISASQEKEDAEDRTLSRCLYQFCRQVNEQLKHSTPTDIYYVKKKETSKPPILFKPHKQGDWRVTGYAGILRFELKGADVVLNIHSRFDNMADPNGRFLMYMFCKGVVARGQAYENMDLSGMQMNNYWDMMMVITFVRQLDTALRPGPFRQYRDYTRNDDRLRGRIDIARHIRENPVFAGKIAYSAREYTVDNDMNRLILRTYHHLKKKYPKLLLSMVSKQDTVWRGLQMLESEVEGWQQDSTFDICRKTRKPIVNSIYHKYEDLRQICHAVLTKVGVNFYQQSGKKEDRAKATGLLIDLPHLWEDFLYYAVIQKYGGFAGPYQQKCYPLVGGYRVAKPDFLIPAVLPETADGENAAPVQPLHTNDMVLDAKYKLYWSETFCTEADITEDDLLGKNDTPAKASARRRKQGWDKAREDVFQVLAYTLALDCHACGVIFPVKASNFTYDSIKLYPVQNALCPDRYFARIPYLIPENPTNLNTAFEKSNRRLAEFLDQLRQHAEIEEVNDSPYTFDDEDDETADD